MSKRLCASILCAVFLLALAPSSLIPSAAAAEKELYSFPFDDEAAQGELFTAGGAASVEWVSGPGVGHGDDTALKTTHTGDTYNSSENAVRLTLPEPLPAGGVYRIVAWVYASSEENPDKGTLTGPGFVLNGDYPGNQGEVKFPPDFGTLPMDEWKQIDVTLPLQESAPINTLDFRIVINEASKHPDVWYWDNIEIYQVGDLVHVATAEWDPTLASLYQAYQKYFLLGNILEPHQIADPPLEAMFKSYYNAVTAGNAMKPSSISQEKDVYAFSGADLLVDWAIENGMPVHGHTLVWHTQSPQWLNMNPDGTPLTRAQAKANLESFITTVAGHFSGRVHSWDVANEAFTDSVAEGVAWRDALRETPWYQAYANGADESSGEHPGDYLYDAFVYARLADPYAILYYLDFNEEYAGKREAMAGMTEEFNELWKTDARNTEPDRLLVEGLGLQAHYWTDEIKAANVEATIQRFIETGAVLSIAELDIPFGTYGTYLARTEAPTEDELAFQADLYRQLFEIFVKYADAIERVTIWGLADSLSWRGAGYPVLFDRYYDPKPTYFSVMGVVEDDTPPVTEPGEEPTPAPSEDAATPAPTATPPAEEPPEDASGFPGGLVAAIIAAAVLAVGLVVFFVRKKPKA